MKKTIVIMVLITGAAGCATSKQIHTSTGEAGYSINCSGSALSWGTCFEKAGDICGAKGYQVLNSTEDKGYQANIGLFGGFAGSIINRSMIIKCG